MSFTIDVVHDRFKFNCAHFVAFKGFRERLHGHNYHVKVTLFGNKFKGSGTKRRNVSGTGVMDSGSTMSGDWQSQSLAVLGADGYLVDFGVVKKHAMEICKRWNERVIIPIKSDVLEVDRDAVEGHLSMTCTVDNTRFLFPEEDCLCLPIAHSTAEELAMHFFCQLVDSLTIEYLRRRNIEEVRIMVGETPKQVAWFHMNLDDFTSLEKIELKADPEPCLAQKDDPLSS